jgi:hypothetical protein
MTIKSGHWKLGVLGLALLVGVGACAVTGVGVGYDGEADYVGGFYEPYGYEYGGWGRGYRVGPPRGGEYRRGPEEGHGPGAGRPYHAAPAGRPMPSMPGRSRGGGGHH